IQDFDGRSRPMAALSRGPGHRDHQRSGLAGRWDKPLLSRSRRQRARTRRAAAVAELYRLGAGLGPHQWLGENERRIAAAITRAEGGAPMNVRMQAGGCSSTIPVAGGRDDACSGRHSSVQRCGGIVAAIAAAGLAFAGVPAEALDATLPPPQTVAVDVNDSMIEAAIGKLDGLASDILKRSGIPGLAVAV